MHVSLLTTIATCVATVAAQSNQVSFIDGNTKIRGVNLGGWLVLEPWIRPSIFNPFKGTGIVDEFTLTQKRPAQAKTILQRHWDEWVTLKDMRQIKAAGFNMVRLPIGFWAYDNKNTPYIKGQAKYVDKLIGWARQVDLKVLIDLHGAPGSQNGFDNSGRRRENPGWQQADPGARRTRAVLNKIQKKYGAASYDDVILGIELLNEPLYTKIDDAYLGQFYYDGFYQQRDYSANRVVVMSDAFRVTSYWNGMLTPSDNGAQNAAMDHHEYQVFDPNLIGMTPAQHRQQVCKAVDQYNSVDKWTIIGEWSGAMTDWATWLNGFERGARYDNTYTPPGQTGKYVGSCQGKSDISTWSQAMRKQTRKYIEVQMQEFEKYTRGWVFWNFKTEGAGEWDALRLVKEGIFPTPGGTYQYPNQCK